MTMIVSNWQILPLFMLVGAYLGMLGALYLAYDFWGRSKILQRCIWIFSSGVLVTFVLLGSFIFFVGPERLIAEFSPDAIWKVVLFSSFLGLMIQFLLFSVLAQIRPPVFSWTNLILSILLSSLLIGPGAVIAPQGSSPMEAVFFALPGVFVIGTLNGFSPMIQWWILHLPEKRVASIGALLIFCAFTLIFMPLLLSFLHVSF